MISLVRSEIRRYSSRRLMRVLAVALLAVLALVLVRTAMESTRDIETARQRQLQEFEEMTRGFREQCERDKANGVAPPDIDCAESFGEPYFDDPRVHARSALPDATRGVAVAVALLAFVTAASFVGADWHHGTMQALLFWEPRRWRVLLAKGAAVVAVPVAFMVAVQALTYAAVYLIAATRGTTEGVTGGLHVSNLLLVSRCALVVAVVSLLSYAIAGLARHTVAAVGVAFVYFAVLENLVRGLRPGWQRFLVTENIVAVLEKKLPVAAANARRFQEFGFGEEPQMYNLTGVRGAGTLALYLAILLGAFYFVFTRRDVT